MICLSLPEIFKSIKTFKTPDHFLILWWISERIESEPCYKAGHWEYSKQDLLSAFPHLSMATLERYLKRLAETKKLKRFQVRNINRTNSYYRPHKGFLMSLSDFGKKLSDRDYKYPQIEVYNCHGNDTKVRVLLSSYSSKEEILREYGYEKNNKLQKNRDTTKIFKNLRNQILNLNKTSLSYQQKDIYNRQSFSKEYQHSQINIKELREDSEKNTQIETPQKTTPKKDIILKAKKVKNLKLISEKKIEKEKWDINHPYADFFEIVAEFDTGFKIKSWELFLKNKIKLLKLQHNEVLEYALEWVIYHEDVGTQIKSFRSSFSTWITRGIGYKQRDKATTEAHLKKLNKGIGVERNQNRSPTGCRKEDWTVEAIHKFENEPL